MTGVQRLGPGVGRDREGASAGGLVALAEPDWDTLALADENIDISRRYAAFTAAGVRDATMGRRPPGFARRPDNARLSAADMGFQYAAVCLREGSLARHEELPAVRRLARLGVDERDGAYTECAHCIAAIPALGGTRVRSFASWISMSSGNSSNRPAPGSTRRPTRQSG